MSRLWRDWMPPACRLTVLRGVSLHSNFLNVSSGKLHVRAQTEDAIDVYVAETGDYDHSFHIPESPWIHISDDRLYQIQDSLVVVYQIEREGTGQDSD